MKNVDVADSSVWNKVELMNTRSTNATIVREYISLLHSMLHDVKF
jgi:hypothetical protein